MSKVKIEKEFEINEKQLYTITLDNSRNLVKALDLLNTNSESESDSDKDNEFIDAVTEINFENII